MNIKKELEYIVRLNEKKASDTLINNTLLEERELMLKINKRLDHLNKESLATLKQNDDLVELLNKSDIDLSYFNKLSSLKDELDIKFILENFDKNLFESIVKSSLYQDFQFIFYFYKYVNDKLINISDLEIYEDCFFRLKENLRGLRRSYYTKDIEISRHTAIFNEFILNMNKFSSAAIDTLKYNVIELFNTLYENNKMDYEILNYINDINSNYIFVTIDLVKKINNTLRKLEENEKIEFKNIFMKFSQNKISCNWINYLNSIDKFNFNINDFRKLSYIEIEENTEQNPMKLLYKQPLLVELFSLYKDNYNYNCYYDKIILLKENLKKKSFIKLLEENKTLFFSLTKNNILFNSNFSDIVNLNTLNLNNLKSLQSMDNDYIFSYLRNDVSLTFNEFEVLYNQFINKKECINADIYYNLLDLKIDERLKLIRQLPSLNIKDINICEKIDFNRENLSAKIATLIKEKSFRDRINSLNKYIERINDKQYMLLFLFEDKIKDFIKNIKYGVDIEFLIKNFDDVVTNGSISLTKKEYYSKEDSYNYFINSLKIDKTFIDRNLDRIIEFCDKSLHNVFYSLHDSRELNEQQRKNLELLSKAEILGKLKDIKFNDEDFDLEIGLKISQDSKNEWKNNIVKKSNFLYEETYDFETIIRLGQYPVHTCQHWNHGMYVRCLLSNFDTNKKMLTSSKDGVLNARSLIRLTKGSENKNSRTSLSFKDIENLNNDETTNSKETLVLFLEKLYTNLDIKDELIVRKEFLKIAKEKANRLNAKLVISDDYYDAINEEEFKEKEYYLFVSYSKNGYQYLDSLTGSCSSKNEGEFVKSYFYM